MSKTWSDSQVDKNPLRGGGGCVASVQVKPHHTSKTSVWSTKGSQGDITWWIGSMSRGAMKPHIQPARIPPGGSRVAMVYHLRTLSWASWRLQHPKLRVPAVGRKDRKACLSATCPKVHPPCVCSSNNFTTDIIVLRCVRWWPTWENMESHQAGAKGAWELCSYFVFGFVKPEIKKKS